MDVFSQLWLSIAFIQNASDLISTPIIIYMPEMQPILPGDGELEHRENNLIDGIEADKENYIFARQHLHQYWCGNRGNEGRCLLFGVL